MSQIETGSMPAGLEGGKDRFSTPLQGLAIIVSPKNELLRWLLSCKTIRTPL